MSNPIKKLERQIQNFIENNSDRLFGSGENSSDWLAEIKESFLAQDRINKMGKLLAPQSISIYLPENDAESLSSEPQILASLNEAVNKLANQFDMDMPVPIKLEIRANDELQSDDFMVELSYEDDVIQQTKEMLARGKKNEEHIPDGAFFIVNGAEIFPLNRAIFNIGRKRENHLILEDAQVSRRHGQLRAVNGEFIFFDLDSSGGSKINGNPISRSALMPGDVLTLAGVPLIYGQDSASKHLETQEIEIGDQSEISGPTDPLVNSK